MVLSWSRAIYVELVPQADVASSVPRQRLCSPGRPRRCLYDNAKVVVLGREEDGRPRWNPRFLDFALRVGFDSRLCRPYRPQTKGRVESHQVPAEQLLAQRAFYRVADLNRQVREWCSCVADIRVHGTTGERPKDRLLNLHRRYDVAAAEWVMRGKGRRCPG